MFGELNYYYFLSVLSWVEDIIKLMIILQKKSLYPKKSLDDRDRRLLDHWLKWQSLPYLDEQKERPSCSTFSLDLERLAGAFRSPSNVPHPPREQCAESIARLGCCALCPQSIHAPTPTKNSLCKSAGSTTKAVN